MPDARHWGDAGPLDEKASLGNRMCHTFPSAPQQTLATEEPTHSSRERMDSALDTPHDPSPPAARRPSAP